MSRYEEIRKRQANRAQLIEDYERQAVYNYTLNNLNVQVLEDINVTLAIIADSINGDQESKLKAKIKSKQRYLENKNDPTITDRIVLNTLVDLLGSDG